MDRFCRALGFLQDGLLRFLTGRHVDAGLEDAACRICGGSLVYQWTRRVMHDKYQAKYYECSACRSLQVIPNWLDEAYVNENLPLVINPDRGRFARNFSAFNYFVALCQAGVFQHQSRTLDFGGGYGLLTQMLRYAGHEAWQYDPYVPTPFLASDYCLRDFRALADGTYDAVFALEVFEHLTQPQTTLDSLARILKPEGTLMLSTQLYESGVHDQNWHYLSPDAGQHVTFYSRSAVEQLARQAGFQSVGYFPSDAGFCILMSRLAAEALEEKLAQALQTLGDDARLGQIVRAWDLISQRFAQVLSRPKVTRLGPVPMGARPSTTELAALTRKAS